jgi:hypothetical protein
MTTSRPQTQALNTAPARKPRRPGVAVSATASLALALVAVGCGGASKTATTTTAAAITKAQFVARANAICAAADPNLAAENAKLTTTRHTPAAVAAAVSGVYVPSVESQVASIKALGTPTGDEPTVRRMLALVDADVAKIKGDPKLMLTTDAFGDFAKVAHAYGLTACAPLS